MKTLVWIGHYIEKDDIFKYNSIKFESDVLRSIYFQINSRFNPYVFTHIKNKIDNVELYGIICPMLPAKVASLPKTKQVAMIKKAVQLACRLGVEQIGIAALFASIWEEGGEVKAMTKTPITTGKNLIAALVVDNIEKACSVLGKNLSSLIIGIIGTKNRISKVFIEYYSQNATVVLTDDGDHKALTKNVRKESREDIFKKSDVIIVTNMGVGLSEYIPHLKACSIVCDIVVPFYLTKEISKKRNDIFAFEGVWSMYSDIQKYKPRESLDLFPRNIVPACVAELLILAIENKMSDFSLSENISLKNMREIEIMRRRHNFEFFGFKQGTRIYSQPEIDRFKSCINNGKSIYVKG